MEHREHLLNGLDDIDLTLEKASSIADYEAKIVKSRPWT
jgi:3-isopropylmalate/(R)-2-methylmalate dehydratase small subunit